MLFEWSQIIVCFAFAHATLGRIRALCSLRMADLLKILMTLLVQSKCCELSNQFRSEERVRESENCVGVCICEIGSINRHLNN